MDSERWQKVRAIFEEAVSLETERRKKFLSEACGADEELRREVENLLESFDSAESFMEIPAAAEFASVIVEKKDKPESGQQIAHYEIVSQIGEGGMGEVFLARDTRLNRKAALKLLAAHITEDKGRVSRFRQEAFATSALNHPNILTIYEIGKWKERDYIAAEFVEGMTLRARLQKKKIAVGDALEIALQIASALAAAHGAGVVHRDIKPENIMIRPDGLVKILDFGIAKYRPADESQKALVETKIGEVIGTAAYMSPEQARGLEVDERTDIWSLGVILYEMLAGKLPFQGATRSDRIAAILQSEPPPLKKFARQIPPELEQTIFRALAKDKEKRCREMRELAEDLQKAAQSSGIEKRSAFPFPAFGRQRKFSSGYAFLILPLILLLAGGAVWLYVFGGIFKTIDQTANKSGLSLQTMKISRLSDTSQAVDVAVSPDGEFVAFIKEENGKQSLWLRQISAPGSVKIAQPAEDEIYGSPVFSPDGSHIFYLKVKSNEARAALYQIPKLGGGEKKIIEDVSLQDSGSNFSLSPDGKWVAFIRLDEGFNRSLVVTDLNGTNERKLISRKLPDYLTGAAFSPDGKQIAVISGTFGGRSGGIGGSKNIVLVGAADAAEKPVSEKNWAEVKGMKWFDDGSGLIVSAGEKPALVQLWHISTADGKISRITNDLSDYAAPSLTANSAMIAAVQINQNSHIWTVSTDEKDYADKQLTFGNGGKDGSFGVSFAPDGEILYVSQVSGTPDIWIVNRDGSENRQLTKDAGINIFPAVSPDGKYIAFLSDRSGEGAIWRMDIDGGNPVQLAKGAMPSFSPDGKWIYFYGAGAPGLWKIPVAGGDPVQIPVREKDIATMPVVSPDNTMLACNYLVGERGAQFRLGILPIEGGEPLKIFDTFTYAVKPLRWTADSRAVSFIETREGVSNIFKHSLDSEKAEKATNFKTGTIWNFDWSNDGKKLVLSRGNITRDVVLISDFK